MLEIFDSLVHPSTNDANCDATSFDEVLKQMDLAGFSRACAVGMPDDSGYDHAVFFSEATKTGRFVPVAPVQALADPRPQLDDIRDIGFRAIKVHPRAMGTNASPSCLDEILKRAAALELTVFLCTYTACRFGGPEGEVSESQLLSVISSAPSTRIILMHGGVTNILRMSDIVRHNTNLLLDLSFTMLKYAGSSIDNDLRFLAGQFDRRICIGTDFPDFGHKRTRERFEWLTQGISETKARNIASKNLDEFLELP